MKSAFQESMLEKDEKVLSVVRPHILIIATKLSGFLLLAVLPLAVPYVVTFVNPTNPFIELMPWLTEGLSKFFFGVWWLLLWMGAFRALTSYYLDAWLITNRRVVDIEQYGFFSREVSSVFLKSVEDATTSINGVFPTLLNYGDIEIQSAAAMNRFSIRGVPNPRAIRDLILSQKQAGAHLV